MMRKHTIDIAGLVVMAAALCAPCANGQTLEDLAGAQVKDVVVQSIAVTISFTAPHGISAGQFTDGEGNDRTQLTVSRFPVAYYLPSFEDKPWQPFFGGHVGWMASDSYIMIGSDVPDRMGFNAWSLGFNSGVRIRLSDHVKLSPGLHFIYGRTRNEFEYISAETIALRELIDGVMLNWEVGTFTVAPSLKLETSTTAGKVKLGLVSEVMQMGSQTLDVDHYLQEVHASCFSWRNKAWAEVPLLVSVGRMPLSVEGDFSRTDVSGDVEDLFLYEIGGQLNTDTSTRSKVFSRFYTGAGYTFNDTLTGWSIRLGADF